jgi:hypothetical protein
MSAKTWVVQVYRLTSASSQCNEPQLLAVGWCPRSEGLTFASTIAPSFLEAHPYKLVWVTFIEFILSKRHYFAHFTQHSCSITVTSKWDTLRGRLF